MNYFGVIFYIIQLLVLSGAFLLLRREKTIFTSLMTAGAALAVVQFPLSSAGVFLPRIRGLRLVEGTPWIGLIAAGLFALGLLGYARGEARAQVAAMNETQRAEAYARRFFGLPRQHWGGGRFGLRSAFLCSCHCSGSRPDCRGATGAPFSLIQ
jgi:hypothetical protein